jgi:hypothetical protein
MASWQRSAFTPWKTGLSRGSSSHRKRLSKNGPSLCRPCQSECGSEGGPWGRGL